MKKFPLRSKRVAIVSVATVAALAAGGVTWASVAQADTRDAPDTVERTLTAAERASAEAAARTAVPGGTVIEVEAGDDGDAAYEVDVRAADAAEWEVELDAAFTVLRKTADD
ncbi:PepSY domain-containing protein [Nucisporomicrobium flavum]|uniref:PepSY domain-containing protein n=1 Tax=Nucisporomicrobium flavum TaxID=2785915 RepID=UPI0018F74BB7|nr:PepSY domain-containing protein [Nucisporomicrobium flavum]